jgi:hypothetical protein
MFFQKSFVLLLLSSGVPECMCSLQKKTNAFIISISFPRIPAQRHTCTLKLQSLAILVDRFGRLSGGIIEVKCHKECHEIMSCDLVPLRQFFARESYMQ